MNSQPSRRSSGLFGRPVLTVTIVLAVIAGAGIGGVAFAGRNAGNRSSWHDAGTAAVPAKPAASTTPAGRRVTVSATGDIMMSNAPHRLPPNDGEGFFDGVRDDLASDLVMGNLEQPLTEDTGSTKCGSPPGPNCFAFRSPPSYAKHLERGGFELMNLANNHTRDYGATGARNTRAALDAAGIEYTGNAGEVTVVEKQGVKVAVVGFSTYAGANNMTDLEASRAVIKQAVQQAVVVVVQVHMGAEGTGTQHVRPGTEMFHGENRGDPVRFTHAVIDAGADLVIGHGPHVLRGMEFYRGKLIAYSLGNFAGGGHALKTDGVLKYGGVLRVTLTADGVFAGGEFRSTMMSSVGLPTPDDSDQHGRKLVAQLTTADFAEDGAVIGDDGSITPPA